MTDTEDTLETSITLSDIPPEPPDSLYPDPPPPAPITVTMIDPTSAGLFQVPFDVQTCMDLIPDPAETDDQANPLPVDLSALPSLPP